MTSTKLTELLQQIGKNTKMLALAICKTKDIEEGRHIIDMYIDLDDGETIIVEFGSRYQGDGSPQMPIALDDVFTKEAAETAIDRELTIYNANLEEKRKKRGEESKSLQEQAEANEKAEFVRLKKKFEGDNAK